MAVVLSSDESGYFIPTSLRRTQSSTNFESPSPYQKSVSNISHTYGPSSTSSSESDPSSAPSSPRITHIESTDVSFASTPASNLSIASEYGEALALDDAPEDHFGLPPTNQSKFFGHSIIQHDNSPEPVLSSRSGDSYSVSSSEAASSKGTSRPDTPEPVEHAEDDTAVTSQPSRQVDYLSHNWAEEDIWTSWRYIVNKRGEFANSARLENASWRTWMKAKNKLKTISPESLNWLKDCDVTWLYGPLQSKPTKMYSTHTDTEPSSSTLSKSDSLVNLHKKPILKKRTMSEIMLQRSLSTASLLKQATASIQAQETRRPEFPKVRHQDDYVAMPFPSRHMSIESSSAVESTDSSGVTSPTTERKHIHFNEQVEQCIAIEVKGYDEDEPEPEKFVDESDSDDGVMMKRVSSKKRGPKRKTSKKTPATDGKIIAMLPSTTLKYREDTPNLPDSAMRHSRSPMLSPSSSQETLRPTRQSNNFYFDEEDDRDSADATSESRGGWRSPPSEIGSPGSAGGGQDEPAGMRRTASGMLMPYEEAENATGDGIIGRVIDTVNTARDIAHVIWNVGWRK